MGIRMVIISLVACLITWAGVLLVFVNVNDAVFIGSTYEVAAESNLDEREYMTLIERKPVVASQTLERSTDEKTVDAYAEGQPFKDGIPIDELLNWLEIEQEVVPSS